MVAPETKPLNLWKHADFLRLWVGQTISVFGSVVGGTAMSFTAALFLHATPFQMSLLSAMQITPAFLGGLFAGAWVDRLKRRPLMILVDIGRAVVLFTIPLTALFGLLHIEQLYMVALVVSILTILFELSYQSYLPTLVGKSGVVDGNSKLSASAAVSEFGGFTLGGWLVQLFTAPFAILIDAISFLVSAFSLSLIRTREVLEQPQKKPNMRLEIREGLSTVYHQPLLRASGIVILVIDLAGGIFGALVVLYMGVELGFSAGILGMIWAVGGLSSFFGASLTPPITRRLGRGRAMIAGLALYGLCAFFIPLARGATLLSAVFLIIQQLGDGFFVMYDINLVSIRQEITAERMLGRVNATLRFIALGASLAGSLIGGLLGEVIGIRAALFIASGGILLAAVILALSPIGKQKNQAAQKNYLPAAK